MFLQCDSSDDVLKGSITVSTRIACSACVGILWALGYFAIGSWAQTVLTFDPSISLDASIPFVGWAIWTYLLGIVWIVVPAWVIRSPGLFRRTTMAYVIAVTLSFLCFMLAPTEAISLRDQASTTGLDRLTSWAVHMLHTIDPATNLLPSLHVSLSTIVTVALTRQYPDWRESLLCLLMVIIVSVCLSKQHTIVDVAGGVVVALAAWGISGRLRADRYAAPRQ